MIRFPRSPSPEASAGQILQREVQDIRASIGELRQAAGLMLARVETLEQFWRGRGEQSGRRLTGAVQGLEGTWTVTLPAEWLE